MDYERMAESMNAARRKNDEPEIPKDELIALLRESERKLATNSLSHEEKDALRRFRDDELERKIHETPRWIKIAWIVILSGALYYFFN